MNEIVDGNIHILNEYYAYILNYTNEPAGLAQFNEIKILLIRKYIEYLIENDKEKIIDILSNYLYMKGSEDFTITYKEPWYVSMLAQRGAVIMKFKRCENDNLVES